MAADLPTERELLAELSDPLRLRTRALGSITSAPPRAGGPFVLYWMRIAVRARDNPALAVAVETANRLGLPVLVYHAVSERYPYASDRHHTFILEGARDAALDLRERGVAYALHVERPGARGPVLTELATRAALVVTEDSPFPPLDRWTARLLSHLAPRGIAVWSVDASCIVPMPLVHTRYDRAYAFRTASRRLAAAALAAPPVDPEPRFFLGDLELPFPAVSAETLDDCAIADLVQQCAIDHAVAPVRERRGGSVAGYARWAAFRDGALARYARDRNDVLLDGTSRLSPYLHYGHVDAVRIAREAAQTNQPGRDKFLDELLVWRDVAWHFAAHTPPEALETLEVLPAWARATLAEHARPPRSGVSLETLERGKTGDALWDSAQRSLLAHGELHNNLRMTWGKAIAAWTPNAEAARQALVELNHRYALDGRDPASYGGLYWCLGLFDRPFSPPDPVLGTVRARPTSVHARRLDVAAYTRHVARRDPGRLRRVAVVGAGVAGLACARTLADHNVDVTVFDKGRSVGGRLSTRRQGSQSFDLGAPYFTADDPRFVRCVRSWLADGVVARWEGRIASLSPEGGAIVAAPPRERYVGTPGMSALGRHLARDLHVRTGHRIDGIERRDDAVHLRGIVAAEGVTLGPAKPDVVEAGESLGEFDFVVVALPAPQAERLVTPLSAALGERARAVVVEPCISLGVASDDPRLAEVQADGIFVGTEGEPARALSWIARDSSKPSRGQGERWVLHASPEWSARARKESADAVTEALLQALAKLLGMPSIEAALTVQQRWLYARASPPLDTGSLVDEQSKVALAGDWLSGGHVEGAFLSGIAAAGRILGIVAA